MLEHLDNKFLNTKDSIVLIFRDTNHLYNQVSNSSSYFGNEWCDIKNKEKTLDGMKERSLIRIIFLSNIWLIYRE